jgi:hypothetical protein
MLMIRSAVALSLFAFLGVSSTLWAKAPTILIEVKGAGLTSPIEITSPEALKKYTFFDGPGVGGGFGPTAMSGAIGSIIDWKSGFVAQPPAGRMHYEISVYWPPHVRPDTLRFRDGQQLQCLTEKPCLVYVAFYDYDPRSKRGFVYLPGKGERWHDLDIFLLYHGVEGHWFKATDSWTGFVRALIAKRSDRSR